MKHECKVICVYIIHSPFEINLCMTQRSDPTPREGHGKILTTSMSFEEGSDVRPHCFQHTHNLLKYRMTMHLINLTRSYVEV